VSNLLLSKTLLRLSDRNDDLVPLERVIAIKPDNVIAQRLRETLMVRGAVAGTQVAPADISRPTMSRRRRLVAR
jgi:hypothetical protein